MRSSIVGIGLLVLSTSAAAQTPCGVLTLGFDPYNPSHAAIVRQYGGAVMAQAPASALLRLDPYVPSQAELLRQVGNGIPVWMAYSWYPAAPPPAAPNCAPATEPSSPTPAAASATTLTRFAELMSALEHGRGAAPPVPPNRTPRASSPKRNSGLTIDFAGRVWATDGAAIPFRDSDFVSAGVSNGFPVYRLAQEKENVIYVPTTPGMVAPFRAIAGR